MKTSLSRILQPLSRSALLKNLSASASSRKPNTTFSAFCQPPLLVKDFTIEGKNAKTAKGNANPKPKPNIPTTGANLPAAVDRPSREATKLPVQLKETITSVSAIKKMPE